MIVTFLAPNLARPAGGVVSIYELANGMSRLGHDVRLVHVPFGDGDAIRSPDDVTWFAFEAAVGHTVLPCFTEDHVPRSDVVVCFDERIPDTRGLPVVLVQAYRTLSEATERRLFSSPWPKACISRWLMDVARGMGVPDRRLVHVPCGLDHRTYRVTTPLRERPLRVSMAYNAHPVKGAPAGLRALAELARRLPGVDVVATGAAPPIHDVPAPVRYVLYPSQRERVEEIYNGSRVFLCPSVNEGFGMASAEAMACGCALVTTDNGGSRDFAIDGETAVVRPGDADALAGAVEALLRDDEGRVALAERGRAYVQRFDWDRSARMLETFLDAYVADPARYR